MNADLVDRVAWAINDAFNKHVDIAEPLRQEEAETLARAAVAAVLKWERKR